MSNTSSNIIIACILLLVVALLSGCASKPNASSRTIIQPVLEKILHPDHSGYTKFSHENQFFTISVEADGLERRADGVWTWTWLEYERKSHYPIFSGLNWSSTGKVLIGRKPQ